MGWIEGAKLYPPSKVLSQSDYPPVELILESKPEGPDDTLCEITTESLRDAVSKATDQYVENVGVPGIEERFQDYLTEKIGLSPAEAIALFRAEGIAPFLLLKRIFISEPLSAVCLDFVCFGEEYLEENEFSLDKLGERVEFVTPRGLMRPGSYPASRQNRKGRTSRSTEPLTRREFNP